MASQSPLDPDMLLLTEHGECGMLSLREREGCMMTHNTMTTIEGVVLPVLSCLCLGMMVAIFKNVSELGLPGPDPKREIFSLLSSANNTFSAPLIFFS